MNKQQARVCGGSPRELDPRVGRAVGRTWRCDWSVPKPGRAVGTSARADAAGPAGSLYYQTADAPPWSRCASEPAPSQRRAFVRSTSVVLVNQGAQLISALRGQ
jgi:hypothetical protein